MNTSIKGMRSERTWPVAYAADALHCGGSDAWETAFELGRAGRGTDDAKIEEHVPAMPFSREVERL
jgi:hypothetical protein